VYRPSVDTGITPLARALAALLHRGMSGPASRLDSLEKRVPMRQKRSFGALSSNGRQNLKVPVALQNNYV
jgi:hypothetical protein